MDVKSLTIVIPCLNEENTLGICIEKCKTFFQTLTIPAEIIVADNGSTDNSLRICKEKNVVVVSVLVKGYGAALHAGIMAAKSSHIIFADADDSYDFEESVLFLNKFNEGYDFVIGNRFAGCIEKGAMPFLHRYLGTPVISYLGRRSFKVCLGDFNCGMRGISKAAYLQLNMQSSGMEYATEMIAKAGYKKIKIAEVPIHLHKDGRKSAPHLKTWRDGWRHLKLILLLSPKWLLLYPAFLFLTIGLFLGILLVAYPLRISTVVLDIHTLYFCSVFLITGFQLTQFYLLSKFYGDQIGIYKNSKGIRRFFNQLSFEKGLITGGILFFAGLIISFLAIFRWEKSGLGQLDPSSMFRLIVPAGTFIILGMQTIIFSFLISMIDTLSMKNRI